MSADTPPIEQKPECPRELKAITFDGMGQGFIGYTARCICGWRKDYFSQEALVGDVARHIGKSLVIVTKLGPDGSKSGPFIKVDDS